MAENLHETELLTKSKCFKTYTSILQEIKKQQQPSTGQPPKGISDILKNGIKSNSTINVMIDFLMNGASRTEAIDWIKGQIREKIDKQPGDLKDCKVRLIIEYNCCIQSAIPFLSPEYAEIRVRIG